MRALEVALTEAQFAVESSMVHPGAGFVRSTAIDDALAAKYRALDDRIHDTSFDPTVPYYLDEDGSVHDLTGRREDNQTTNHDPAANPRTKEPRRWWQRLMRRST